MADEYKPKTADVVDMVISAELPNKDTNSELHNVIITHQIHGPCRDRSLTPSCIEYRNRRLIRTKHFPESFPNSTIMLEDT